MDGDGEREVMSGDGERLTAVGLVRAVGAVGILVAHPQLGDAVHCGLALKLGSASKCSRLEIWREGDHVIKTLRSSVDKPQNNFFVKF